MQLGTTKIIDTFAEAFAMWAARVVITADTPEWAMIAAQSMTGFATSIIGCKCEAGIEALLDADTTPDARPGVSVLLFATSADSLEKRLVERVGQSVMTCPTTACFNGLEAEQMVDVGGKLRYFGDGYQISKMLGERRLWRVPVMDGEFVVDELFGIQPAVGGGNIIVLGAELTPTLQATQAAVSAMRQVPGVIMPFPGGIARSGSKPGSRYSFLFASTNDAYCPTLRGFAPDTQIPDDAGCVLEIVIDGLDEAAVQEAMRAGTQAAADHGALYVTAGNYGGKLGQYQIRLYDLIEQPRGFL